MLDIILRPQTPGTYDVQAYRSEQLEPFVAVYPAVTTHGVYDVFLQQKRVVNETTPAAETQNYTLALDSGSFTFSGQDVGLLAGRTLVHSNGSFAVNGQALGLVATRTLSLSNGSFTLTGQGVGLTASRYLTLSNGSLSLNGQASQFSVSRSLMVNGGGYTFTGNAVDIVPQSTQTLSSGSFVLTGGDVTITTNIANVQPPISGGGGWYAPRRTVPRERPRIPVAYSVAIGSVQIKVKPGDVSCAVSRRVAINSAAVNTSAGSVSFLISRTVAVRSASTIFACGECRAEIVREIVADRPFDRRLAETFARRATPLSIETLVMAVRREARRPTASIPKLIRSAHVAAAALGCGGIENMRNSDWFRVDAAISRELRAIHLITSRPATYGNAVRQSYETAVRASRPDETEE